MLVVTSPSAVTGAADLAALSATLDEGWEPFAVTDNLGGPFLVYHLRRSYSVGPTA